MKADNKTNTTIDLPQFISKVKRKDKIFKVVYMAIIVLYIIIIVAHLAVISISIYNNIPFTEWISNLGTLLPFVVIYFFLMKRHKEYKKADYSLPTYLVVKNMEKRYRWFRLSDLWVVAALFFLGISMGIDSPMGLFSFQLSFWAMILVASLVGYIYWYFRIKPLRDKAARLIKELEE